mgnify:CR=1 FL=1
MLYLVENGNIFLKKMFFFFFFFFFLGGGVINLKLSKTSAFPESLGQHKCINGMMFTFAQYISTVTFSYYILFLWRTFTQLED